MTTVKELHDELTDDYNRAFNSGETSGKVIEFVKQYSGIVPMMEVFNKFNKHNKCSLVYLHTVIESRFSTFEEEGKTYIDFDNPIGVEGWTI